MFRYIDAINKEPSREFKIEPLREEIIIEPIEEDVESKANKKLKIRRGEGMNYFKLVDGIRSPQSIDVVRSENGYKNLVGYVSFQMNDIRWGDDEAFIQSLENASVEKLYSDKLVTELENNGIQFEVFNGGCCGGKIKK